MDAVRNVRLKCLVVTRCCGVATPGASGLSLLKNVVRIVLQGRRGKQHNRDRRQLAELVAGFS
jgi:hypothetical protein